MILPLTTVFLNLATVFGHHKHELQDSALYLNDYYIKMTRKFNSEPICQDCIVFAGNSITQGGDWNTLFPGKKILNRGIGGDITEGLLNRTDEIIRHQPSAVFIKIGINDINRGISTEEITDNYVKVLQKIRLKSPQTKIYVQSVLPVRGGVLAEKDINGINIKIKNLNTELAKIAASTERTEFIDLNNDFADKTGLLRKELTYDGLHLNPKGYKFWAELLKQKGYF